MPLTYCRWTADSHPLKIYKNALTRSRKKGAPFLKARGEKRVSQNWQVGVGNGVMLSTPVSLTDYD